MKEAIKGYSKEAGIENQADNFHKQLLLPIQLNMERHRYVLSSGSGPLVVSPVNAVGDGDKREYVDHYAGKQYSVNELDEKIKSVADCVPVADPQIAEAIRCIGTAVKEGSSKLGKKDVHFFGGFR